MLKIFVVSTARDFVGLSPLFAVLLLGSAVPGHWLGSPHHAFVWGIAVGGALLGGWEHWLHTSMSRLAKRLDWKPADPSKSIYCQ
jgi:hypothetical protein